MTSYPDVDGLLETLLAGTRSILDNRFVGMYLHGSLALGDFDPDRSDVDFLVVTRDDLPKETVEALAAMHRSIAASGLKWKTNYEGPYFPREALRRHDRGHPRHPALSCDGAFGMDEDDYGWIIQRHVAREHGIVLAGPPLNTLIDPVGPDDLRRGTLGTLQEWWAPKLADSLPLRSSEYQAYTILTMCRALYTLHHGTIATKPQAAEWAIRALDPLYRPLIDMARRWRRGVELDCLEGALELIRYTLTQSPP